MSNQNVIKASEIIIEYMYRNEEKSFMDVMKDGDNKLTTLYRLQHHVFHSVLMLKFNGDETKFNEWFDEFCDDNGICEIYDDELEDEEENHTCHLCGYECADMVYPDKEETPFCDKCWIKEQLDINSIYYAGDYNEDDEFLETKCGCEIIVNSREHDECRCDDDGENWICSECYNGEYDEKENALGCCSECAEELVDGYWWSRPERGLRFCADCGESVLKEEEEL